jgi:hypothetical protein
MHCGVIPHGSGRQSQPQLILRFGFSNLDIGFAAMGRQSLPNPKSPIQNPKCYDLPQPHISQASGHRLPADCGDPDYCGFTPYALHG